MKFRKMICMLLAVVCLVSCFIVSASAAEPERVFLNDETVQTIAIPYASSAVSYVEYETHKFKAVTIYNHGESTLYITIGTYETSIASGKGKTLTYTTFAERTIKFESANELDYTTRYD